MLKANVDLQQDYDSVLAEILEKTCPATEKEWLPLNRLVGRILAEDVLSPLDLPSYRQSAMDGYGIAAGETVGRQKVVTTISAGDKPGKVTIEPGQAVRIMTGAAVPAGIDYVIPQEQARIQEDSGVTWLFLKGDVPKRNHIKAIGSDVSEGQCVLKVGHRLRPQDIGLLASIGLTSVNVFKRVRVVVLTSGNELAKPGESLQTGQVYDANAFLITSLCEALDVDVLAQITLPDEAEAVKKTFDDWQDQADVILSVGGASVGEKDFVASVIRSLPNHRRWKLKMKPAKPFSMGMVNNCMILALPGNPVAAFMSFQVLAKPVLKKRSGRRDWPGNVMSYPLKTGLDNRQQPMRWLPVRVVGEELIPLTPLSGGDLAGLSASDGFVRFESGREYVAGDAVRFWRI